MDTEQTPGQTSEVTPEVMDRRKRYYLAHRHTEVFKARISKVKKAHYQRNRDVIKAKALQRYYDLKGVPNPNVVTNFSEE